MQSIEVGNAAVFYCKYLLENRASEILAIMWVSGWLCQNDHECYSL